MDFGTCRQSARPLDMIGLLFDRLSAVHDNHKRIAAGAALIGGLTLIAKMFVAAREVAIAWRFGVGATVDAYQLSLTLTTWLPMMFGGVTTVVLVPTLVGLRRREATGDRFVAELNGNIVLTGAIVAGLTWLAAPAMAALLASSTEPHTLELTRRMSRTMAPIALFMIPSAYFCARLQARERFWYSISDAIPAILIALAVLAPLSMEGPNALVAGTLAGFAVQVALLALMVSRSDPPLDRIRLRRHSANWQVLYKSLLFMTLGQVLITFSTPIDQAFAARLGEGAVATLGYANRVIALFSGFATIIVARALLPVLSASVAAGELELARRQAIQWSVLLFIAAAIGSIVLWALTPDAVRLLFQRGAFTPGASTAVAGALRVGLLQLPFYFAGMAFVQWYAATGQFKIMLWNGAAALGIKVIANAALVGPLGVKGIMTAAAVMYAANLLLLVLFLKVPGQAQ
jgi:murein biosynthesis integral membrane protein MurJ